MSAADSSSLMEFVSSFGGGDGLRVEESLGEGYVRLRVSEAERRQAKHDIRCVEDAVIELLRNARDANATHIFVAISSVGNRRDVLVFDDGDGIPQDMHERVFEARVTSKLDSMHMDRWGVHGRGMALYSIRENAEDARVICSESGLGTALITVFDTQKTTERADQSTWPVLAAEEGSRELRGPHNIIRECVEFAIESRDLCKVYVGSPAQIVATMRVRMLPVVRAMGLRAFGDLGAAPIAARACLASDARELRQIAGSLGIEMSERNAHRIVRGDIAPLRHAYAQVMPMRGAATVASRTQDRRLHLTTADRDELADTLAQEFQRIAGRYYFELSERPRIRIADGKATVTFCYIEQDD